MASVIVSQAIAIVPTIDFYIIVWETAEHTFDPIYISVSIASITGDINKNVRNVLGVIDEIGDFLWPLKLNKESNP